MYNHWLLQDLEFFFGGRVVLLTLLGIIKINKSYFLFDQKIKKLLKHFYETYSTQLWKTIKTFL